MPTDPNAVCFTPAGIAIITALMGALCAAVGVLFRALLAAKDAQIAYLESLLSRSVDVAGDTVSVAREGLRSQSRRG